MDPFRRQPVFFGWKVVATAFLVAMFAWGVGFYGLSVFLNTLHGERGWSVSIISAAITTHFLLSALLVAYLAEMHRRFGVARVTRAGVAVSVIGVLGWSLAAEPWQMFAAAVLSGAGWASTSAAAVNAMVSPWFDRRRAIALSHAFNGVSAGGIVFTPLWVALIGKIGFVGAASVIAIVMLIVLWPLSSRYLSVTPDTLDVRQDGDNGPLVTAPLRQSAQRPMRISVLLRDKCFVTLSVAFALGMFAQIGVITHLVTRLALVFSTENAAAAVSLTTVCAVIGRLLVGSLIGDADRRLVALGIFAVQAFGMACLAFGSSAVVLLIGCILFGFGLGNLISISALIAQSDFADTDALRVVALATAVSQAVFAFAPGVVGLLNEVFAGYRVPFAVTAAMQVVAGLVIVCGRVQARLNQSG